MFDKPGLPVIIIRNGTGSPVMYDRDGNVLTITASQRIWIDTASFAFASNASDYSGGSLGPVYMTLSNSGTNIITVAAPDSTTGASPLMPSTRDEFPGRRFPLARGRPTHCHNDPSTSLSGAVPAFTLLCRLRPVGEG